MAFITVHDASITPTWRWSQGCSWRPHCRVTRRSNRSTSHLTILGQVRTLFHLHRLWGSAALGCSSRLIDLTEAYGTLPTATVRAILETLPENKLEKLEINFPTDEEEYAWIMPLLRRLPVRPLGLCLNPSCARVCARACTIDTLTWLCEGEPNSESDIRWRFIRA